MFDRARVDFDHNRLLKKVANGVFTPLGLVQHGSSRTWFDDHGWWVVTVQFDASGFGKGSYLRVGTSPLWMPTDYIGIAYELRDTWAHPHANFGTKFIEARRPEWWERDVGILAEGAADYVRELRATRRDVRTFLDLERETNNRPAELAIPAGLLGQDVEATPGLAHLEEMFTPGQYTHAAARRAWDEWVHARVDDLQRAVGDRSAFLQLVADNVARTRVSQRLPPLPGETIVRDLHVASLPRS